MPKPLRLIVDFLSYEGTMTNAPQDALAIKRKVEESDVSEVLRVQRTIDAGASDVSVTFPDASMDYLLLFVDQEITIKLNGSADAITLTPKTAGKKCPVYLMRGTISALTVSNAGATDANLDLIAVNI